jgi:hypothetical protein
MSWYRSLEDVVQLHRLPNGRGSVAVCRIPSRERERPVPFF